MSWAIAGKSVIVIYYSTTMSVCISVLWNLCRVIKLLYDFTECSVVANLADYAWKLRSKTVEGYRLHAWLSAINTCMEPRLNLTLDKTMTHGSSRQPGLWSVIFWQSFNPFDTERHICLNTEKNTIYYKLLIDIHACMCSFYYSRFHQSATGGYTQIHYT